MRDIVFNYYPADIHLSAPLGEITLEKFLGSIKYPKKKIVDIFDKIRAADQAGDLTEKNRLKTQLYSFTPCVYVRGTRKYDDILHWTGLLALDFDKLPSEEYAVEWKEALFEEYKIIIACWLSPSRRGVRALVKIPVVHSVGEFKEYFRAIEEELAIYRGFDRAVQNCILPMFLSYDPDLLMRENYEEWKNKIKPPAQPPPVKQYIIRDRSSRVEKIISSKINRIEGNGHPQLRAAAYLLGGYVGAGYMDCASAIQMLNEMVDGNDYLSKKSSVYKRTVKTMVEKGRAQPVYLK